MKLLLLDDIRNPTQVYEYTKQNIFLSPNWETVKNYTQFINWIIKNGLPELISFDHDLADVKPLENSTLIIASDWTKEKTGMDCAKWLIEYCITNNLKLPKFYCHSMNPIGKDNITSILTQFSKTQSHK